MRLRWMDRLKNCVQERNMSIQECRAMQLKKCLDTMHKSHS